MAIITNEFLLERLQGQFGDHIQSTEISYGMATAVIAPEALQDILHFLHDDPILKFRFLTDVCGSHYPDLQDRELCVVYHVQSMENNIRLRLKAFLPVSQPEIITATSLYESANWQEREVYDFYGVVFTGHPNLKRIMNVEEMDYFPLRKEYPVEDPSRADKADKYFGR